MRAHLNVSPLDARVLAVVLPLHPRTAAHADALEAAAPPGRQGAGRMRTLGGLLIIAAVVALGALAGAGAVVLLAGGPCCGR
jgi:hypothetical protein